MVRTELNVKERTDEALHTQVMRNRQFGCNSWYRLHDLWRRHGATMPDRRIWWPTEQDDAGLVWVGPPLLRGWPA